MTSALHQPDTALLAHTDVIVLDYLAAVWAASDDLQPELRDELMSAVADHIARRRVANAHTGESAAHVLRLLGPAEDLAAAARRGRLPVHLTVPTAAPRPPTPPVGEVGQVEYTAVALLTVGAVVLPGVGPLAGILLTCGSARWRPTQKVAAAVLAVGPLMVGLLLAALALVADAGFGWAVLAYLAMVSGPFAAGLTLLPGLFPGRRSAVG
jgi:hypothetical protein